MLKFIGQSINLKKCPKCENWFGVKFKKRKAETREWRYWIQCNSCGIRTSESIFMDQPKLDWNAEKFEIILEQKPYNQR